ncbi:MAG: polymer-forming cytoskeletal protein, partial [Lutibacter sp.]
IGASGSVNGKIICDNADIEGIFSGELLVNNLLTLKATAKISGDVAISKLLVEPGAEFNATCTMKISIMELQNDQSGQEKTA